MTVTYHPDFPKDIRKFQELYKEVSEGLAVRFRDEIDEAIMAIKAAPQRAGHYLQTGSKVIRDYRRRNLKSFPFFVLYAIGEDKLMFGSIVPSRSDPLMWLVRFSGKNLT